MSWQTLNHIAINAGMTQDSIINLPIAVTIPANIAFGTLICNRKGHAHIFFEFRSINLPKTILEIKYSSHTSTVAQ